MTGADDIARDPWGNPIDAGSPRPARPTEGAPTPPPARDPWTPTPPSAPAPPPAPPTPPPAWPTTPPTPPTTPPAWPGASAPLPPPPSGAPTPGVDGRAVTSLVLGILSITCAGFLGIVLGPLAIVFGVQGRRRIAASQGWRRGDGLTTAGIVLGVIGLLVSVVYLVFLASNPDFVQNILDRLTTTTTTTGGSGLKGA